MEKSRNKGKQSSKILRIDTKILQGKLGPALLANFTMLLSALNRINALWDFMWLTHEATKDMDSARSERNRAVAIFLSIGVLQELYCLLRSFCGCVEKYGITYKKIIELLSVYDQNSELKRLLRSYRNQVSFHLSKDIAKVLNEDQVEITKGIDSFIKFGKGIRRDTYYFAADETINRAFFKYENANILMECQSLADDFDNMYKDKMAKFLDYVVEIHKKVTDEGEILIISILDEFKLEKGDFTMPDE